MATLLQLLGPGRGVVESGRGITHQNAVKNAKTGVKELTINARNGSY
jgi:hypothetical protein